MYILFISHWFLQHKTIQRKQAVKEKLQESNLGAGTTSGTRKIFISTEKFDPNR